VWTIQKTHSIIEHVLSTAVVGLRCGLWRSAGAFVGTQLGSMWMHVVWRMVVTVVVTLRVSWSHQVAMSGEPAVDRMCSMTVSCNVDSVVVSPVCKFRV